jgi:asparagine synthase (glutamine-hydrolysing)
MCGIAGIIAIDGFDPQTLVTMTHLVKHRGPDGFGFACDMPQNVGALEIFHNDNIVSRHVRPVVGLGNRRLAILDLSPSGNMPMVIQDGALCVTYNGEIYNYRELRAELESLGHSFRSGSDTEVLLHSYAQWAEECVEHFNGMWSFALWDRKRQRLFCSRDRFGVKPFYYAFDGRTFYFGSELKQLIYGAKLPRIANARVVYHFLEQFLFDYSDGTFFENIQQLRGGHSLTLDLQETLRLKVWRHWELQIQPDAAKDRTESDVCDEFRELWENAVRIRLRSDVPVGSTLSGGIDSSSVICQARKLAPAQTFHTFSSCIEEKNLDERPFISAVAKAIGSSGHLVYPKANSFWQRADQISYHQDEPIQSGAVFAQWSVMEAAREHGVPVLLGGQGGDETLCGYQKYRYFYLWQLLRHGNPQLLREGFLSLRNGTQSSWTLTDASRYFPAPFRTSFSVADRVCASTFRDDFATQRIPIGASSSISERQKLDLTLTSIPSLLHLEDRNSMAHSIETRLPFLDYKLVEFAVNCPASLKLKDGWSKWILRNVMKGAMPDEVRLRKSKLGFDVPQTSWMRDGLSNGHRDLWDTGKLRMARFLDGAKLARETRRFLNAERGALPTDPLFRAISLEHWARVHNVS